MVRDRNTGRAQQNGEERWELDFVLKQGMTMRDCDVGEMRVTEQGRDHLRELIENSAVKEIVPEQSETDQLQQEIVVVTDRSSEHIIQRNEGDAVGWLCRVTDSPGINVWSARGKFGAFVDTMTIEDALLCEEVCGHCQNKLAEPLNLEVTETTDKTIQFQ